ncbi:MAG: hypothetical protein ACRYFX_27120 [Janthinobacterium lividum]
MKHHLHNTSTGSSCILTLAGTTLTTATGKPGKERTTQKDFATAEEARQQFEKKEWEALKKGFVLHQEAATAGEPLLHYYVGTGYTGCLSLVGTPQGIYVYKHGWYKTAQDQTDFLVRLDATGQLLETIELPQVLPWQIAYNAATNTLLLDLDHYVYEYSLVTGEFEQLTQRNTQRGINCSSFVAVGPYHLAFATEPSLYVQTLARQPLLEMPYATTLINGDWAFAAALSKNGDLLALHTVWGEIQLLKTTNGTLLRTLTGDFTKATQLEFVANDTLLAVRVRGEGQPLLFFSVADGSPVLFAGLKTETGQHLQQFCFNPDESRLVLVYRHTAYVFDFSAKRLLYQFDLQHTVKRAHVKFIGEALGVRTDYGCFSLYAM